MIENALARDLGGIMQPSMGYRLGYERSRPYTYALATLIFSWDTAPVHRLYSTDGEGDEHHQTEYNLGCHRVCVVAATQAKHVRLLAGMNRTIQSNVFFF